jgi:hypothetical protein
VYLPIQNSKLIVRLLTKGREDGVLWWQVDGEAVGVPGVGVGDAAVIAARDAALGRPFEESETFCLSITKFKDGREQKDCMT